MLLNNDVFRKRENTSKLDFYHSDFHLKFFLSDSCCELYLW